jgi:hypothetical protein
MPADIWAEHRARLYRAGRQLAKHPGWIEQEKIDAFKETLFDVYIPNATVLLRLLVQASQDRDLAMELMQNARRPNVRVRFEASARRALHNYVAATMTTVDHSRRLMKGREGPVVEEFRSRVSALNAAPEHRFFQELRNNMLHHSLPTLGHSFKIQMNYPRSDGFESEVLLNAHELLEWGKWSPSSRQFLNEQQTTGVLLRQVVRTHLEAFLHVNHWLYQALQAANSEGREQANVLITMYNAILSGEDPAVT